MCNHIHGNMHVCTHAHTQRHMGGGGGRGGGERKGVVMEEKQEGWGEGRAVRSFSSSAKALSTSYLFIGLGMRLSGRALA